MFSIVWEEVKLYISKELRKPKTTERNIHVTINDKPNERDLKYAKILLLAKGTNRLLARYKTEIRWTRIKIVERIGSRQMVQMPKVW